MRRLTRSPTRPNFDSSGSQTRPFPKEVLAEIGKLRKGWALRVRRKTLMTRELDPDNAGARMENPLRLFAKDYDCIQKLVRAAQQR